MWLEGGGIYPGRENLGSAWLRERSHLLSGRNPKGES
jgi:hypothetical protein